MKYNLAIIGGYVAAMFATAALIYAVEAIA